MIRQRRCLLLLSLSWWLTACSGVGVDPLGMEIVEDVVPLQPMALDRLCVRVNETVKPELTESLFDMLEDQGLATQPMATAFAGECPVWVRYEASWTGFPSYLEYALVEVVQGSARIGRALYDARRGGGRPDRFGAAAGKLRPLIDGMFHHLKAQRTGRHHGGSAQPADLTVRTAR